MNLQHALEDELNDLDIPIVMLDAAIMILGDALDIGPLTVIDAMLADDEQGALAALRAMHGATEVDLMTDMIEEGIESTTQLPHLRRALEIHYLLKD